MESKDTKSKGKHNTDDSTKAKEPENAEPLKELSMGSAKRKKKKLASAKNATGKKHPKAVRDANAPKYPFTGYVRFSNERREELKKLFPEMMVLEVTKKMAEEWNTMDVEKKKPFLDAADIDKQRYSREMKEYQEKMKKEGPTIARKAVKRKHNSNGNTSFSTSSDASDTLNTSFSSVNASDGPKPSKEKAKNGTSITNGSRPPAPKPSIPNVTNSPPSPPASNVVSQTGDIPIFTDQFLEHNRKVDSELRMLRKSNIDYEQQNSVLEKHVENMTNGIAKLTDETQGLVKNNEKVQVYLDQMRLKLATALAGLSIPSKPNGANMQNIDGFMDDLLQMASSNSHGPASLNKAKDIIRKLDLNIQL